jgi:hypothetical protein
MHAGLQWPDAVCCAVGSDSPAGSARCRTRLLVPPLMMLPAELCSAGAPPSSAGKDRHHWCPAIWWRYVVGGATAVAVLLCCFCACCMMSFLLLICRLVFLESSTPLGRAGSERSRHSSWCQALFVAAWQHDMAAGDFLLIGCMRSS